MSTSMFSPAVEGSTLQKMVRDIPGMIEVFRNRIQELGLTHATVDALSGLPDGYCSKLMCGMKRPGPIAIDALCGALAIGFVPVVDETQQALVRDRWVPRKRPLFGPGEADKRLTHHGALFEG